MCPKTLTTQENKLEQNPLKKQQILLKMLATTIQLPNTTPHHQNGGTTPTRISPGTEGVASGPNSVPAVLPLPIRRIVVVHPTGATTAHEPITAHTPAIGVLFVVLLRKEVIQPHLPVRLPCYDFVPIADPTFDSSPQRVRPLASGVTDFHDVTGGVYKARERIHRSVADLRLLATPTSRGRVADPDPN